MLDYAHQGSFVKCQRLGFTKWEWESINCLRIFLNGNHRVVFFHKVTGWVRSCCFLLTWQYPVEGNLIGKSVNIFMWWLGCELAFLCCCEIRNPTEKVWGGVVAASESFNIALQLAVYEPLDRVYSLDLLQAPGGEWGGLSKISTYPWLKEGIETYLTGR